MKHSPTISTFSYTKQVIFFYVSHFVKWTHSKTDSQCLLESFSSINYSMIANDIAFIWQFNKQDILVIVLAVHFLRSP